MREWLLYCVLCSLIYTLAVEARPISNSEMTAELLLYTGARVPVRDCAVFMPDLGSETQTVKNNLKTLGFSPQVSSDISIEKVDFKDSNGHNVTEYNTIFDQKIGYYGRNTILMSLKGYDLVRRKKTIFILKLHRLGAQEAEIASSVYSGVLSEQKFSVKDFPRCRSQISP